MRTGDVVRSDATQRSTTQSRRLPGRLIWLSALVAIAAVAAGCSSSPTASHATTSTTRPVHRHETTTSTSTTSTSAPTTTTAPPVPSSNVVVQISGSSATIQFTSSDVSGSLSPETGTFSQGGTVYTFLISGVQYSGGPSITTATGGLIASLKVSSSTGGASITIMLTGPASHASYGLGHDEVGVSLS
jgi:hypothetical protein